MKYLFRKLSVFVLAAAICVTMLPFSVFAEDGNSAPDSGTGTGQTSDSSGESSGEDEPALEETESRSGTCGENLGWSLSEDGTLLIESTGADSVMDDYSVSDPAPWNEFAEEIKSVTLSLGEIGAVGDYAFYGCKNLESVAVSDETVMSWIGDSAFYGCASLKNLTNLDSVMNIGSSAFFGCSSLQEFSAERARMIGKSAFALCTGLTRFSFSDSIRMIEESAFQGCTGLIKVYIPETVETIAPSSANSAPFAGCSDSLIIFTRAEENSEGWNEFWNLYESGKALSVSYGVSAEEFEVCNPNDDSLRFVDLRLMNSIPAYAFYGCSSLTEITVPENVENIGSYAFAGCENLKTVIFHSKDCVIGDNAFGKVRIMCFSGSTAETYAVLNRSSFSYIKESPSHPADKVEKIEAVEPSCTEGGNEEYYFCRDCGKYFSDNEDFTEIYLIPYLPANGHSLVENERIEPTCTEDGNDVYWTCSVCLKNFSDAEGTAEAEEDSWIFPKGHVPGEAVKENFVDATCTEYGKFYNVVKCERCGARLEVSFEIINPYGHLFTNYVSNGDATLTQDGTKTAKCERCDETDTVTDVGSATGTSDPTPLSKADVSLSFTSAVYTGSEIKPAVTVSIKGETVPESCYKVTYSNNIDAGKASLKITAAQNSPVKGSTSRSFTISKAPSVISLSSKSDTYDGKAKSIGSAAVDGSSGKVTYVYYTNKACTKKTTKAASGSSKSGYAPKNVGTYYVKAKVAADDNYNAAVSAAARFVIKQGSSAVTLSSQTAVYTGEPVEINPAEVTGSTGKITYIYYTNRKCTKKTTVSKNGAAKNGGAPSKIGTYYVKAKVAADSNYKAAVSKVVKFVISYVSFEWNDTFLLPRVGGLGTLVSSYDLYLYKEDEEGNTQLMGQLKNQKSVLSQGVRKKTDPFTEGSRYKIKVVLTLTSGSKKTVNKWMTY